MASVQRDEMMHIQQDTFDAGDSFLAHSDRQTAAGDSLSDLEREVLDYAGDGFTAQAISDMLSEPDADIYKALIGLLAAGVIELHG